MMSFKTPLAALAVMAGLVGAASSAQAMPVARLAEPAGVVTADFRGDGNSVAGLVEQVRNGCGRGWHAGRWGRCVPNRMGPRPYYGPRRYYGPRVYYRPPVYYGRPWHRPYYGYGPRPWHRLWYR